ncbi:hypothetical protein NQ318_020994 [Aromia moschata]|uniref:Transposase n=1 Tax=Aromia moschata TaxID=1265417 RepID=A0AAV8YPP0_9CUCU|nr:hypothetical protein NQ318_020994 [Aromia moschata]
MKFAQKEMLLLITYLAAYNEVYKLSNETGIVAPDLATLRRRDLEGRFCFRLGHSATDTFAKLQHAYGAFFKIPGFSVV